MTTATFDPTARVSGHVWLYEGKRKRIWCARWRDHENIEHARGHCRTFVDWYNHAHRHSGIALMTPAAMHYGHAPRLQAVRSAVLDAAYDAHPERFVRKPPAPPKLPAVAWINKPKEAAAH